MTTLNAYSPAVQSYLALEDQDSGYLAAALSMEIDFNYEHSKELSAKVAAAYQALTENEKIQVEKHYYALVAQAQH